jgi:uncharacterized protein YndB with AHSA1/START domain
MQTQSRFEAKHSVMIHAPIEKVWAALTTPDQIKQWFFGVDTETDWKPGSPLVHRGRWQGKSYEDKGTILRIEPPHLLVHNHWSGLSGLPDRPENYQQVTFALAGRGSDTELTLHEVNIPGEEARALSEKSWKMVLQSLKELLER